MNDLDAETSAIILTLMEECRDFGVYNQASISNIAMGVTMFSVAIIVFIIAIPFHMVVRLVMAAVFIGMGVSALHMSIQQTKKFKLLKNDALETRLKLLDRVNQESPSTAIHQPSLGTAS